MDGDGYDRSGCGREWVRTGMGTDGNGYGREWVRTGMGTDGDGHGRGWVTLLCRIGLHWYQIVNSLTV
jgi:hypothetical protein